MKLERELAVVVTTVAAAEVVRVVEVGSVTLTAAEDLGEEIQGMTGQECY